MMPAPRPASGPLGDPKSGPKENKTKDTRPQTKTESSRNKSQETKDYIICIPTRLWGLYRLPCGGLGAERLELVTQEEHRDLLRHLPSVGCPDPIPHPENKKTPKQKQTHKRRRKPRRPKHKAKTVENKIVEWGEAVCALHT